MYVFVFKLRIGDEFCVLLSEVFAGSSLKVTLLVVELDNLALFQWNSMSM